MSRSLVVLTDSGGVQEETTALGIPCLALRNNTKRPVTIDEGTNVLAGTGKEAFLEAWNHMKQSPKAGRIPNFGTANAAGRCLSVLRHYFVR
jgi:UDP-N-acetylglucosamine 2-epimerase (non-hydrolysing)